MIFFFLIIFFAFVFWCFLLRTLLKQKENQHPSTRKHQHPSIYPSISTPARDGHPHELGAGSFSRNEGTSVGHHFRNQPFVPVSGRHEKGPNIAVRAFSVLKVLL